MNLSGMTREASTVNDMTSKKVSAIKIVRKATGLDLLRCKWLVDDNPEVIENVIELDKLIMAINDRK